MKRFSFFLMLLSLSLTSCGSKKESADLMLTNAKVYTVNDTFDIVEALVVKEGKIIFIGTTKEANERF